MARKNFLKNIVLAATTVLWMKGAASRGSTSPAAGEDRSTSLGSNLRFDFFFKKLDETELRPYHIF